MIEKRRHTRATIDLAVSFVGKAGGARSEGLGKDISIGGIFVETEVAAPFGSEVVLRVRLATPSGSQDFDLPGVVRWIRSGGMGLQFGLLGALETHAITELTKG